MIANLLTRTLRFSARPAANATNAPQMIEDGCSSNMERHIVQFDSIPGMLTRERGIILYCLALGQTLRGDIVEIGSWQGRSTCYLARACEDSDNGVVRVIDHFEGNDHSKDQYVVGSSDLSDLCDNFKRNIASVNLNQRVQLYEMGSRDAVASHIAEFQKLRMLFIDGDHDYDAVRLDIQEFAPQLQIGGLIVFDDYHNFGVGVTRAVQENIFDSGCFNSFAQFNGFLIARKAAELQPHVAQVA